MNKELFKRELKELLNKYDVFISFNVDEGSDTYGIYGENITFSHRVEKDKFIFDDWITVNGWTVSQIDIE